MPGLPTVPRWGWAFLWLTLLPPAAGEAPETSPAALLTEAAKAAEAMPQAGYGIGWGKPLVLLRIADTMRLHGMTNEALATVRQSCTTNKEVSPEECRDQDTIELCRLLTLLGQRAEAESLAETAKFRSYSMPARYLIARAAAEMGDTAAVEAVLRHPCFTQPDAAKAAGKSGGDMWRRACVGIALEIGRPDLARQLIDATTLPLWKSAGLGDQAVA